VRTDCSQTDTYLKLKTLCFRYVSVCEQSVLAVGKLTGWICFQVLFGWIVLIFQIYVSNPKISQGNWALLLLLPMYRY